MSIWHINYAVTLYIPVDFLRKKKKKKKKRMVVITIAYGFACMS
jgi:hypothetical protein